MAKFNFNVTGVDHKKAVQNFESPKPGMYRAKIAEMNPGFSKDDAGKEDKSRPRVEVIFHLQDKTYNQTPMWYFLTFSGDYPLQKLDQFLQAVGVNTAKTQKGSLDTDKYIGKIVNVRVKSGTNQTGEYRGEVGGVFAAPQDDEDMDEDEEDLDDEDESEDEDEESEDEDEEEEDEDDGLDALSIKDVRARAKEIGVDSTGLKPAVIERIRAAASEETEEEEDEPEDEEEETEDDGYDELSLAELKVEFKDRELDLPKLVGPEAKKKAALIAALRANDEEPF